MSKQLILSLLPFLSPNERQDILSAISNQVFQDQFVSLSIQIQEQRYSNGHLKCPFCQSHRVVKNGKRKGVPGVQSTILNYRGKQFSGIFVENAKNLFHHKHKQLRLILKKHLIVG